MQTETKCPKCGAEMLRAGQFSITFKCGSSDIDGEFGQSMPCIESELSTLRAALSKALGECESEGGPCSCHESYLSLKAAGYRRDDPNCVYCNVTQYPIKTLRDALSTLTRAENGDL